MTKNQALALKPGDWVRHRTSGTYYTFREHCHDMKTCIIVVWHDNTHGHHMNMNMMDRVRGQKVQ